MARIMWNLTFVCIIIVGIFITIKYGFTYGLIASGGVLGLGVGIAFILGMLKGSRGNYYE